MKPGDWRIWYGLADWYEKAQGPAHHSPPLYVVGITQNSGGRHYDLLASGLDHYILRSDLMFWMEVNDRGLQDQLTAAAAAITAYRAGFQMLLSDFKPILAAMQAHIDLHQVGRP